MKSLKNFLECDCCVAAGPVDGGTPCDGANYATPMNTLGMGGVKVGDGGPDTVPVKKRKKKKRKRFKRLYEFLINSKSTGIIKNINDDFVDLGLSVLWAKCNIGAKEETDYGHYYQWGGLEPMDAKECDWITTPFNNGKNDFDEDYFKSIKDKVCQNGILAKEYDIAYKTYGDKVHMPTNEDFEELINKTKHEWINNYNNSGINGRLFTGKNGNSIFIPAAGFRRGTQVYNQGSNASVWSSRVSTSSSARYLYFNKIGVYPYDSYYSCCGQSVRPVK